MRTVYEEHLWNARKTEGQIAEGRDRIVRTPRFGAVARVLWPTKTAAHIAAIAGRDERTAKRWLSGEYEPPYVIVEATMHEIFGRDSSA